MIAYPPPDVVHLAQCGWSVAARVPTATVPRYDRTPLRSGVGPLAPAHVQGLAVGPEHDPRDLAVAGDPVQDRSRDRGAVVQLSRRQPAPSSRSTRLGDGGPLGGPPQRLEGLPADVHAYVRAHLRPAAGQSAVQNQPGELGQGVRTPLVGGAEVVRSGDADYSPQCGCEHLTVLGGEEPLDGHAVVPRAQDQPLPANRVLILELVGGGVDLGGPALDLAVQGVRPQSAGLVHESRLVQVGGVRGERQAPGLTRRREPGEHLRVLEGDLAIGYGLRGGREVPVQRLAQRCLAPSCPDRGAGALRRPLREGARAADSPPAVLLDAGEEPRGQRECLVGGRADPGVHLGGLRAVEPADGPRSERAHGIVQARQVGGPTLRDRHPAPPASKAVLGPTPSSCH